MPTRLTNKKISYQEYLQLDNEKRYEVINGDTYMVPAPTTEHQYYSRKLEFIILKYVEKKKLGEVFDAPIDVILDENNIVQPDILFIAKHNTGIIKKKGIFGAPDLVVEIISKSSKYRDHYEKKDLYEKFQINEYWLVDQYTKSIVVLTLNAKKKYELFSEGYLGEEGNTNVTSKELKGLRVDLEEVFHKTY